MKILFITLSNIGDVILTLPALDILRQKFPDARITVMTSLRAKDVFFNDPGVKNVVVYDKRSELKVKIRLFFELKAEKFDLVVDLRNSFLGVIIPARFKSSPFLRIPCGITHMRDRHIYRVKSVAGLKGGIPGVESNRAAFNTTANDNVYVENILRGNGISEHDEIVAVAPGARSHTKMWLKERFVDVCAGLVGAGKKIILVGDDTDAKTGEFIIAGCQGRALNMCARTNLQQLAALLKKSKLVITNDSATLHLASYLNVPVLAVFGPTDNFKYGPWSDKSRVVKREISCRPCEKALCRFGTMECMRLVRTEELVSAALDLMGSLASFPKVVRTDFKRILIARTDRIGDVVLSTPVIRAMRQAYPDAYIAMLVASAAREVVDGSPLIDEVIVLDKEAKHSGWLKTLRFARLLRNKKFELALILHPTNRVHLLAFLAGIPKRVGYNRKMGFLLTERIAHEKQSGRKHELEYNLDLVRYLGIEPKDKSLFMQVSSEAQGLADAMLKDAGIAGSDRLLAIHPAASCPSKIWPKDRFAQVADALVEKYGFKVVIVAGPKDVSVASEVASLMRNPSVNLAGKTSLAQLAGILKECKLFISNDSGPVHVASAVGTPVISIFGRSQKGLAPSRWGPVGEDDRFLHKDVGCIECLAHNCINGFECLGAITVEDVLNMVDLIFKL